MINRTKFRARERARTRTRRAAAGWASAITIGGVIVIALVNALGVSANGGAGSEGRADAGETFVPPAASSSASPGNDPHGQGGGAIRAPGGQPTQSPERSAASGTALEQLATLPLKGRAPKTGYDRVEGFGRAWLDVDKNGCDTRNDILARDLVALDRPAGCRVLRGLLIDPYTGTAIDFVRGQDTSQAVQIDHVVALSNAWQTGAQALSFEQRVALANDPLNLLAVDGPSNQQKSDADAATWLPPNKAFRCEFVARQVSVKAAHGLWVTPPEQAAIARVLASCPDQPVVHG